MKKIIKFIDLGTYPGHFLFAVGMSHKEICQWLKRNRYVAHLSGLDNPETKQLMGECYGLTLKRPSTNSKNGVKYDGYTVLLREFNRKNNDHITVLAHELLHLTQFYLGERVDRTVEYECEAYFHGYVFRKCLDLLS